MATVKQQSVTDLVDLTGLTVEAAKSLFDLYNGFAPALASFVQSLPSIPKEHFQEPGKALSNAKLINQELRVIYTQARAIRDAEGCSDAEAWSRFYAVNQESSQATAKQPSGEHSSEIASTVPSQPKSTISFGFGASTPAPSQSTAPISFGFGTSVSSSPPAAAASSTFTFAAAKPADAATEDDDHMKKPTPKYVNAPNHFTGPFFEMEKFWEDEVVNRAPLLNLDCGFLERHRCDLADRVRKWLGPAEFYLSSPVQYVAMDDKDEYYARVIIKDAVRTFFNDTHREKFHMFLYAMFFEFGNYGQAMSYLAGICLLVLNEQETAAILRKVSKAYIPGHWAAEATGFATSAWVVEHFMQKHFPDVAEHFKKMKFWPDTYLQKIMSGLCVHVLRFEDLFDFLDQFMEGGFVYLLKFCLSMIEHFRAHLLKITAAEKINELFEIMRLDSKAVDRSDVKKILQRAPSFPLQKDMVSSLDVLRSEVYQEKVAPRIQRAPKTEAFEPCAVCDKKRPTWWNDDLGAVCSDCKANHSNLEFSAY
eukprot:CAMPEP_0176407154 /NCGR_PEP_ID=MMETSP0127-20121128/1262_1 /TAXON_ID=938130 /ORGANISM="Platyophrya macrostoma, Strain WH" /LENGTH=535 /DNA_ID=CAMNT_0017786345 /DNA_START=23 /DNA_END=1630 /DNA_ORIENTATION=-